MPRPADRAVTDWGGAAAGGDGDAESVDPRRSRDAPDPREAAHVLAVDLYLRADA